MFGDFGENMFGDLEKTCSAKMLEIWRNMVGDWEKNRLAKTLEIWRNMGGIVMTILYWSSSWSSVELGDRKWRFKP